MKYLVVTGVDKNTGLYNTVCVDSDSFTVVNQLGYVDEAYIVTQARTGAGQVKPLNFSITQNGKLNQSCGAFTRFSQRGSAVILAEIQNRGKKTVGYRLLSCANNACVDMSTADVVARELNMPDGEHFLQNGIVRNKAISCYPNNPFPVINDASSGGAKKAINTAQLATLVVQGNGPDINTLDKGVQIAVGKASLKLLRDDLLSNGQMPKTLPQKLYVPTANVMKWLVRAEDPNVVFSVMTNVNISVPPVGNAIYDDNYVNNYCPELNAWFSRHTKFKFQKLESADDKKELTIEDVAKRIAAGKPIGKSRLAVEHPDQVWNALRAIMDRLSPPNADIVPQSAYDPIIHSVRWLIGTKDVNFIMASFRRLGVENRPIAKLLADSNFTQQYFPDFDGFFSRNDKHIRAELDAEAARNRAAMQAASEKPASAGAPVESTEPAAPIEMIRMTPSASGAPTGWKKEVCDKILNGKGPAAGSTSPERLSEIGSSLVESLRTELKPYGREPTAEVKLHIGNALNWAVKTGNDGFVLGFIMEVRNIDAVADIILDEEFMSKHCGIVDDWFLEHQRELIASAKQMQAEG